VQEWCQCGASIKARRKDVIAWRTEHRHDVTPEPEPEKQGAFAQAEHAGPRTHEHGERSEAHDMPIVYARIGFVPNDPPSRVE